MLTYIAEESKEVAPQEKHRHSTSHSRPIRGIRRKQRRIHFQLLNSCFWGVVCCSALDVQRKGQGNNGEDALTCLLLLSRPSPS